ncbi:MULTISPECIES: VOC family protein [Streptomyces]|uniref:VOC family protein n=1 Tax=Streptomyces TaxID=1883 RepID=UPI0029BCF6B8|nr:VOC family protein [Streptomyces sp. ND04-05B]MDX3061215.1 VOC family protein [Streptomyces sp. ND04-05B]WRY80450.1 VOC family protein [Streptomyces clavifer]
MIRWTYACIDRPTAPVGPATDFWTTVTGTHASAPWGAGRFTTLLPDAAGGAGTADACLVVQAVGGPGGAHPDLAVEDVPAFTARAARLGAAVGPHGPGSTVLRSPGGQPFCVVPWRGQQDRPPVHGGPGCPESRLDQLCLDVAPASFEAEVVFWTALTGWDATPGEHPEFVALRPRPDLPVHLLLQRLTEARPASAHLDIACPDLGAGRAWHERCGASFVRDGPAWTVMRDPAGGVYCLTRRAPETGR